MGITPMFFIFMYILGCLWAFDFGHKVLKGYKKISPTEFVILIVLSLMSWIMLLGLFLGKKLKDGSDGK